MINEIFSKFLKLHNYTYYDVGAWEIAQQKLDARNAGLEKTGLN